MADLLRGGIAINEVLADPNGAINFDTDGSGTAEGTDEYIELVNLSGAAIDISGLQLWDAGVGNYFTFPAGTILEPGAHAMVQTGVTAPGSLPTGGPDDLFFDAGRATPAINNGGDNIIVYDPAGDAYIAATFNGDSLDDPTLGVGGYSGFSATATQSGLGEDFGNDTDGQSLQRTPDGADDFTSDTPTPGTSNVCFVNGTLLATPDGLKPVEVLLAGMPVETVDHGAQPVKWSFAKSWSVAAMKAHANLRPVVIRAGALGPGLPLRDLRVSQQHRILVSGPIARRMFGEGQVLLAAKHLTLLPGIQIETPTTPITYFHIMLAQHDMLLAEGVAAESLYLGQQTLTSLPHDGLQEIAYLMGREIAELMEDVPDPVRQIVTGKRAKRLVRRLRRNQKAIVNTG